MPKKMSNSQVTTKGSKKVKSNGRIDELKKLRDQLEKVDLSRTSRFNHHHVEFSSFASWCKSIKDVKDIDKARSVLYFGFQPLYDALINDRNLDGRRHLAVEACDRIVTTGTEFLTGYYLGQPNVKLVNELGSDLKDHMEKIDDSEFRIKFRNVDYNGITPEGILSFLKQFVDYSLKDGSFIPDYVVGCACGSSEVVMPLAGIFGSDIGFIRRSYRRGDDDPIIVDEHEPIIKERTHDKNVACVEDYICTSASLRKVMQKVRSFHPSDVRGFSVNGREEFDYDYLKSDGRRHKFQAYKLR